MCTGLLAAPVAATEPSLSHHANESFDEAGGTLSGVTFPEGHWTFERRLDLHHGQSLVVVRIFCSLARLC